MKKRRIEVAVISDVHLGSNQCHAEELLAYLSSIRPKKLILNGDIIDSSQTATPEYPQSHYKVLKSIIGMAANGTEVYYLCGRQEAGMRRFSGYDLGLFHVQNKLLLELDGKKTWIFHGDVFGEFPGLCHRFAKFGTFGYGLLLGLNRGFGWVRTKLGRPKVTKGIRQCEHPGKSSEFIQGFEKTVSDLAIGKGVDSVICGHLHRAEKKWVETPVGKTLYMNSGDWVENLTALEYNFKRWKLYRYDEDKLSPFFADEDLKEMDLNDLISSIVAKKEIREARQKANPSEE